MHVELRSNIALIVGLLAISAATFLAHGAFGQLLRGQWNIETYEHYCELNMRHRATEPPFYPDILIRFHVPTPSRQGDFPNPDYPFGQMVLWLYSYLPNVPAENAPLNRIEYAMLDGKRIPRTQNAAMSQHDDIYRTFEIKAEEAMSILESFSNAFDERATIDLILRLSNGEEVRRSILPNRMFRTKARMLSVCMEDGFSH